MTKLKTSEIVSATILGWSIPPAVLSGVFLVGRAREYLASRAALTELVDLTSRTTSLFDLRVSPPENMGALADLAVAQPLETLLAMTVLSGSVFIMLASGWTVRNMLANRQNRPVGQP